MGEVRTILQQVLSEGLTSRDGKCGDEGFPCDTSAHQSFSVRRVWELWARGWRRGTGGTLGRVKQETAQVRVSEQASTGVHADMVRVDVRASWCSHVRATASRPRLGVVEHSRDSGVRAGPQASTRVGYRGDILTS